MRRLTSLFSLCVAMLSPVLMAQTPVGHTHSGQLTHQAPFPQTHYRELPNPHAPEAAAWEKLRHPLVGWGSCDLRYAKQKPVKAPKMCSTLRLKGWRGERVAAQWYISTPDSLSDVHVEFSPLRQKNSKSLISKQHMSHAFVRYVMTDELNPEGGGCGLRPDASRFDSSLVADVLDTQTHSLALSPHSTQGGWFMVDIPHDAPAGLYQGELLVKTGVQVVRRLPYRLVVSSRRLPRPSEWQFHLDLWQNPYAVARYHQVPLWSKAHFERLRPVMEMYRDAGGKVITASIMERPWNGQTFDAFHSMITWLRRPDGTWAFDYDVFDRWVSFCRQLGLKQINCYTMIPWHLSFPYVDQASNSIKSITTSPGDSIYCEMWSAMLVDFARHLKAKGWFADTYISMDERPMKSMQSALKIIRQSDANWKVAFAGNLHPQLLKQLDDYCLPLHQQFTAEQLAERRKKGQISTFYTCCTESKPNTFTFSAPAEAEWLPWHAAYQHLDGYLRWALNSWTIEPLLDSRFYTWAAGDTYMIYPGVRSSVRFERLRQGIESFEKLRILRQEWQESGNTRRLKECDAILKNFDVEHLDRLSAEQAVAQANSWLNQF